MSKAVRRIEAKESRLTNAQFKAWLDEPVFVLRSEDAEVVLTRRGVAVLAEAPCTRAATILHHACKRFKITTIDRLYNIGLHGLMRIEGVGFRSAWIAALILEDCGFDVDRWLEFKPGRAVGRRGHIKLVHSKTAKQKHG